MNYQHKEPAAAHVHRATLAEIEASRKTFKFPKGDKRHPSEEKHWFLRFHSDAALHAFMADPDYDALREGPSRSFDNATWESEPTGVARFQSVCKELGHADVSSLLHRALSYAHDILRQRGMNRSASVAGHGIAKASGNSHAYLRQVEVMDQIIGEMFAAIEPELHALLMKSHAAGRLHSGSPGPFLSRSVISKAQGKLHDDPHDMPISAMTCNGPFIGGKLLMPQPGIKLA